MRKNCFRLTLCAVLFALCVPAWAQQPTKIFRIGFLDGSTASGSAVFVEAFRQELSKLGWIAGKNFTIEYRFGENKGAERLRELAADLVRLNVDLFVCTSTQETLAARRASTSVPIVMTSVGDPVGTTCSSGRIKSSSDTRCLQRSLS